MEDEQLEQMWKEAWREYEALSGHDFLDLPRSVDAATLVQTLERQIQSRENWDQAHDNLWKSLKAAGDWAVPVVAFVTTLASGVPVTNPAQMVLGALQFAIKIANGVAVYLKQILLILDCLCALSKRLSHYKKTDLSPELRGILVKQLTVLLKICAISTRQMQDKSTMVRTKLLVKSALKQQDEVPLLLEELKQGIKNEILQTGTETLVAVKQNASWPTQASQRVEQKMEEMNRKWTDIMQLHTKKEFVSFYNLFIPKGAEKSKTEAISLLNPSDLAQNEFRRHDEALVEGGLGNWIREDVLYQKFKAGHHSRLLVAGFSGSGKSFLAHNVISDLRHDKSAWDTFSSAEMQTRSSRPPKRSVLWPVILPVILEHMHVTFWRNVNDLPIWTGYGQSPLIFVIGLLVGNSYASTIHLGALVLNSPPPSHNPLPAPRSNLTFWQNE